MSSASSSNADSLIGYPSSPQQSRSRSPVLEPHPYAGMPRPRHDRFQARRTALLEVSNLKHKKRVFKEETDEVTALIEEKKAVLLAEIDSGHLSVKDKSSKEARLGRLDARLESFKKDFEDAAQKLDFLLEYELDSIEEMDRLDPPPEHHRIPLPLLNALGAV